MYRHSLGSSGGVADSEEETTVTLNEQQPVRQPPAAYAGALSCWVGIAPGSVRKVALEIGGMAQLMGRVGWSAVRRPSG